MGLTHWGQDKMVYISQTTFSNMSIFKCKNNIIVSVRRLVQKLSGENQWVNQCSMSGCACAALLLGTLWQATANFEPLWIWAPIEQQCRKISPAHPPVFCLVFLQGIRVGTPEGTLQRAFILAEVHWNVGFVGSQSWRLLGVSLAIIMDVAAALRNMQEFCSCD